MIGRSCPLRGAGGKHTSCLVFLLAMLVTVSASSATVITKSYSFTSDPVSITPYARDTTYDVITMSNCIQDDRLVGAPQLPQRAVSFLIPYNQKLDSVVDIVVSVETLSGSYNPVPIQPPRETSIVFYPPLLCLYEGGFPGAFADGAKDGAMATFRLASFYLRPIRLLPDGRLVKVESLTVEVHTSGSASFGGVTQGRRSKFCDEELKKAVGAIVENPGDVNTLGLEVPIDTPRSPLDITELPSLDGDPVDCVIVTARQDSSVYERYAKFLTERGIVAQVRTLERCRELYSGADDAARVRAFVTHAYSQWGTLYAILGGWPKDATTGFPTRMIRSQSEDGVEGWKGWATTDAYYSDLEGTWNENGDDVYAEPPLDGVAAFYFADNQHGWAVAQWSPDYQTATAFLTVDGGSQWSLSSSVPPGVVYMSDMTFVDDEHGWCVGMDQVAGTTVTRIWETSNGGLSWHVYEGEQGEQPGRLSAVYFVDANNGWAVGWSGSWHPTSIILRTTDGGAEWTSVTPPFQAKLYDVEFSGDTGWITTDSNVILRSTNGGDDWSLTCLPDNSSINPRARYVSFADATYGWATGRANLEYPNCCAVWATTDGGATWQSAYQLDVGGGVCTDIQAVLTEGSPPSYDVWVSTIWRIYHRDHLGSWTLQLPEGRGLAVRHVQFLDADHGWAAGLWAGHGYLWTSDGGDTWTEENPEFFWGDWSAQDMLPEVFVARLPSQPESG